MGRENVREANPFHGRNTSNILSFPQGTAASRVIAGYNRSLNHGIHGGVLDRKGYHKFVLIDDYFGAWQLARTAQQRWAATEATDRPRPMWSGQWRSYNQRRRRRADAPEACRPSSWSLRVHRWCVAEKLRRVLSLTVPNPSISPHEELNLRLGSNHPSPLLLPSPPIFSSFSRLRTRCRWHHFPDT